jgi:hypothetical protein
MLPPEKISCVRLYKVERYLKTFASYVVNCLVFITDVESVYSAVRTDSLYKANIRFVFKRLKHVFYFFTLLSSLMHEVFNCEDSKAL